MKNWFFATRPKTLTASLVPILVSTALVKALGYEIHWWISGFALLSSLFIQVGTNLFNDAVDFKKGTDRADRLGPVRVTASGIFSYRKVIIAAVFCFILALLFGIPLVYSGGWPILILGLASLFFGYGYTGGPFPLSYLGLGDLFVILFFGLVAVGGLFFLQTGKLPIEAIVLGLQVGFHCTILIAINNLRDMFQDVATRKRTLPVRFGKQFGRWEIAFLCFAPFILNLYWLQNGHMGAMFLPLFTLPLAAKLVRAVFKTEPSREYNLFLAKGAGLHLLFGLLMTAGLWL